MMEDNASLALNAMFAQKGFEDGVHRFQLTFSASSESEIFAEWPTQLNS